jgi:hypothetical protein
MIANFGTRKAVTEKAGRDVAGRLCVCVCARYWVTGTSSVLSLSQFWCCLTKCERFLWSFSFNYHCNFP